MSLRLAVWYPQGRAGLPLAARLFREQLAERDIVWTSDEPTPTAPGVGPVDLWLVLCATTPPEPPPWRQAVEGVWAVFPGTAESWTAETDAALKAWQPCLILTDLLPDETDNPILRAWWRDGDVTWLPAWHTASNQRQPARGFSVEASEGISDLLPVDLVEDFAASLFSTIQPAIAGSPSANARTDDRLLLCSVDPIFSGITLRDAASQGVPVIVLGAPGSATRRRLLGGSPVRVLSWPGPPDRIRPMFDALREAVREPQREASCEVPDISASDWMRGLIDPSRTPADNGGAAAQLAARYRRLRSDPRHVQLTALASKLVPDLGLDLFLPAALNEASFARLARCEPGQDLSALASLLAETVPEWIEAAGRWGLENGSAIIGHLLWTGVCDHYRTVGTQTALAAAAAIYAAAGIRSPEDLRWLPDRAVLAAVMGDFPTADAALERLRKLDSGKIVPAMLTILRAWLPGLECGEENVVPPGGAVWWRTNIDQCVADGLPSAGSIRAYGALWMDSAEEAAEMLVRAGPALMEAASFGVLAWLNRRPEIATRVWAPYSTLPLPESPTIWLTVLCAKALCEPLQLALLVEKRRLDAEAFGMYERTYPSHQRCFFGALIHARCGDEIGTATWRARAEAEDTMAARRSWFYSALAPTGTTLP